MRRTQLCYLMTTAETWPVCRLCRGSMKDWRETWLPWKTRCVCHSTSFILPPPSLCSCPCSHTSSPTLPPSLPHSSLQVATLGDKARQLQSIHTDSADQIAAKQAEIVGLWEGLKRKASQRGTRLGDALCFQKFLSDCRWGITSV